MALIAIDGFDGGGTTLGDSGLGEMVSYIEARYPATNSGATTERFATQGGWGSGQSLSWGRGSSAGLRYFNVPIGSQTEIFLGFAIQPSITPDSPTANVLVSFRDEVNNVDHILMYIINGTHIVFYRGSTLLVSALGLKQGRWSYVETRVVLSNTVGVIDCRVNGTQIINETTLDTIEGGTSTALDTIRMRGARGNSNSTDSTRQWLIDDMYILDTTGSVNNTFLGPTKVETLFPTAEGATINFTPSTGTDNSALVDENPRNDDTDYNSSADTASNKDLLAAGNLSVITGSIKGVQVTSEAKLDVAGSIGLQSIVAEGTPTQGTGAVVEISSTANYSSVKHIFELNPDTASAWSAAEVDGMEIGYEID